MMVQSKNRNELIKDLNMDMIDLYKRSIKEIGYKPSLFYTMLTEYGPLDTAKKLINKSGWTDGFTKLWEHQRLDLSVEVLVLNPKYRDLFTAEELQRCRERLAEFGYDAGFCGNSETISNTKDQNEIVNEVQAYFDKDVLYSAFDRFVEFIHDTDENELPLDFTRGDGILKREEYYKSIDVVKAREILSIDTWNETMVGSGEIGARAKKAINKCFNLVDNHSITKLGNLVDIYNSQYSADAEKAIYRIYKSENEKEAFDYAKSIFGGTYDLLACLFFIKDEERFLPIRSENFDKRFARLGINFRTSARCSWENYNEYIRIIDYIKTEMNSHIPLVLPARLLDAHSFVWIIGEEKYIGWTPNKEKCVEEVISIEEELNEKQLSGGEERTALVKIRINQGAYRRELLKRYHSCALCGMGFDKALIASHIKPWKDCTKEEKTDINNGFMLCPNHDKLFDTGFISFEDDGRIIISKQLSESDYFPLNINSEMRIELKEDNVKYLRFHRKLFEKNLS